MNPLQFITAAQFLSCYDARRVGQLTNDLGYQATVAQLTDATTVDGQAVVTAIQRASDEVMAAAAVAARYSPTDLATYGGNLLVTLTADIAFGILLGRRALATEDFAQQCPRYAEAMAKLEQLRQGERIFWAVPNVPQAGLPEVTSNLPILGVNPPLLTQRACPLFGTTLRPGGPQGDWA